jgi:hypothetical protein
MIFVKHTDKTSSAELCLKFLDTYCGSEGLGGHGSPGSSPYLPWLGRARLLPSQTIHAIERIRNGKEPVLSGASGILAVLLACLLSAHGGNAVPSTPFIALSGVSVPEIPAKAAELVHAAAAPDRDQTAQDVLRAVSVIASPGVLPYVVSAISRTNPEVAGCAVATAIALQPEDVLIFSKAALCAAPGQVERIVFSACKAAPASCADVALVASRQLPSANNQILAGLAGARPELELYLEEAEIEAGPNDFEAVIERAVQLFNDALKAHAK